MIELKNFERSDFKQLIDWIDTAPFMIQWSGSQFEFPLTDDQLEKYIQDENSRAYKVIYKESCKVIGHISLGRMDKRNQSARIGKVLVGDKKVRGIGIGQQMITEILKIAFNELHLHRVSLGVFDFNNAAIACYEKAGFTKEGLLRDSTKNDDEYWSMWEMSILEKEWHEK
jgi:RimJ/RimL family protein N-acetyltransferase